MTSFVKKGRRQILFFALATVLTVICGVNFLWAELIPCPEPEPVKSPLQESIETRSGTSFKPGTVAEDNPWPGKIIGLGSDSARSLFYQNWPMRSDSFELHFKDRAALARIICGLAYFSGDLPLDMPLKRCLGGVQGFHYSSTTVRDWARAVQNKEFDFRNHQKEEQFISWLIQGGVLIQGNDGLEASARLRHIIGAASGKKRSLGLNLNHERLHVMWDEDPDFKQRHTDSWRENPSIKEKFLAEHPSYSHLPDSQQVEEWAIRTNELHPPW